LLLLYLAISKKFEPLLLVPIGFAGILANIPEAGLALSAADQLVMSVTSDLDLLSQVQSVLGVAPDVTGHALKEALHTTDVATYKQMQLMAQKHGHSDGFLYVLFSMGISSTLFPLLIFMGVGAMTDFGPLLANPKTLLLGAAAQFGIFATLMGAVLMSDMGIIVFTLQQAAAIGIIGGADGPTAIYVASILAPELLGAIAVSAYSYMALVPMIQPPIMRALTSPEQRKIKMVQLRPVSKLEKIVFPVVVLLLVAMLLPDAAPL
jgi:oxaloacetate decarboxylase beta subunit